ncbi:hypothetical protein K4K59_012102 [Colletotrichum sp. SAR11_240]|nr:hypothetical protein K4K59_012102 [Colletotrichum sp. SAR11_240]
MAEPKNIHVPGWCEPGSILGKNLHGSGYYYEYNDFVDISEGPIVPAKDMKGVDSCAGLKVYWGPGQSRMNLKEYLDRHVAALDAIPKVPVILKDNGKVDLMAMKQRVLGDKKHCWGICKSEHECPPTKWDDRCIVWAAHLTADGKVTPHHKAMAIGYRRNTNFCQPYPDPLKGLYKMVKEEVKDEGKE